ncbi:hypothetical protein QNM99_15860 [Pseudomonas sp. PCH446]
MDHYLFVQLRQTLEQSWNEFEVEKYANFFGDLPQAEHFESWANQHCETHRSNLFHPLFDFLRDNATRQQLTEFLVQETPFDVHFGISWRKCCRVFMAMQKPSSRRISGTKWAVAIRRDASSASRRHDQVTGRL